MSQLVPADRRAPVSFVLLWLGAWVMLLIHLGGEWWLNPQYGYGLVVPLLCGWILWERREELFLSGGDAARPCSRGAWALLILGALSLLPLELLRQVNPQLRSIGIYGFALCLALTFWALRRMGWKPMPAVVFGTALLFATAVPWPAAIEMGVTQSLMRRVARFTSDVMGLLGILAIQRGNLIELRSGVLHVDEACSGVRSLQSCIMASVAIGQFFRLSWKRQAALLAGGVLLAFAGNILRTLTLTLLAAWRGTESVSFLHDPAGLLILTGVTLILFGVGKKMEVLPERAAVRWTPPDFSGLPRAWGICLLAAVVIVAAHGWYWIHEAQWPPRKEPFLTLKSASDLRVEEVPVPPAILEVLAPDRAAYYQCRSRAWGEVAVYSFFWLPTTDNLVGFFHRPDVCMPSAGWQMDGEVREISARIGGEETSWYVFSFERQGRHLVQAWGVWRDGVEQGLDFSKGWRFFGGQHFQIWRYVLEGRRRSNTQIVSVILDADTADDAKLTHVIETIFTTRPPGAL